MSCVVKCCKNRSDRKNKNQGITFHRFPKENEVWKNDWIEIIRNCNCDNDWIPNKYSVICNLHFEACDLYTTKGGLRRVVTYAVPQKFLFEPADMAEEKPAAVPYIPSTSQEDSGHREIKKEIVDETSTQASGEDPLQPGTSYHYSSDTNENVSEIEKQIKIEVDVDELSPNISVEYLDSRLNDPMSTRDNCFDIFGQYVATMLKKMPLQQALDLQPQIVNLITSTKNDCGDGSKRSQIKIEKEEN